MPDPTRPSDLVLGIDTGGTFTDGILLYHQSRQVLATHKSLTTKRDFAIGIEQVIDGIDIEDPAAINMVSISTTLATNAIAEGKGKRVALLLIGYDPELIASFKLAGRFATPNYYYFRGGHDLYGREREPLDLPGILEKVIEISAKVDALAVSSYFSPLNPEHENRTYKALAANCDLPIVLGHQLSTKLGSVERATTAALNASLLAALQDFVIAVRRALEHRHIAAPLMVVRGDGTLMSDAFAARSPVETIHSGPAASAIGGRFLSGVENALVVDVGGTTTDIALVEQGQVAVSEDGATVADYKTSVRAANLLSIALGGDSHIHLGSNRDIRIGPERVTPISYIAWQYDEVLSRLKARNRRSWDQVTPEGLHYWYLQRKPADTHILTSQQKALVRFLQGGPKPVPEIMKHLGVLHISQIDVSELFRREILGRAGLTPTDLLHTEDRFTPWSAIAATEALQVFAKSLLRKMDEVRTEVWDQSTEIIVRAIIGFLTDFKLTPRGTKEDSGRWFFDNSLYHLHPYLKTTFTLGLPIIGIGAPAAVFLQEVARVLHTELILPEHYEVANAVGAVAGSVMVTEELLVYPRISEQGLEVLGYIVQTSQERQTFEVLDEALIHARRLSRERALAAALRSGADNPQVIVEEQRDGIDTVRVRAKAVGNPRLSG